MHNILVEPDCLEVVNLLNNAFANIPKVFLFMDESKTYPTRVGISFLLSWKVLLQIRGSLPNKAVEELASSLLFSPYRNWFGVLMSLDVIL